MQKPSSLQAQFIPSPIIGLKECADFLEELVYAGLGAFREHKMQKAARFGKSGG